MKIVNIIGGLGNQMFQYAFAVTIQSKYQEEEVLIDTSHFHHLFIKKWKTANLHNGYEIEKIFPNATLGKASAWKLMRLSWYMPNYLLSRIVRKHFPKRKLEFIQNRDEYFVYNPAVYELNRDCYYEGLWESVHYYLPFKRKLMEVFAHPNPDGQNAQMISQIESEDSVGVHIRRGDYLLTEAFTGICGIDYYQRAIEEICSDGREHSFYIFSNDMQWCKENITPLVKGKKIVFVVNNTGSNSCWDMFLMTHCKNLIIANSSFSWWGAFLNPTAKKIIAPQKWMNRNCPFDIWDPQWIKM